MKLLLLFLIPLTLFAIDINEQTQKLELLSHSAVWIDANNSLNKQEVSNQTFTKCTQNTLTHGYAPHRSVWIKIYTAQYII